MIVLPVIIFIAAALVIAGCSSKEKKKGNFSVIDTRPVPQIFVYSDQSYTVLLKPGSGQSIVEVSGMAYSLTDSQTDKTRAEQVGANYLAGRGQCGSNILPFPVSGSQVFNPKHEFWSVSYRCS